MFEIIDNCLWSGNLLSFTHVIYFCVLEVAKVNLWTSTKGVGLGLLLNSGLMSSIKSTLFPTDSW